MTIMILMIIMMMIFMMMMRRDDKYKVDIDEDDDGADCDESDELFDGVGVSDERKTDLTCVAGLGPRCGAVRAASGAGLGGARGLAGVVGVGEAAHTQQPRETLVQGLDRRGGG